jgi:hypothetical protein
MLAVVVVVHQALVELAVLEAVAMELMVLPIT